VAENATLVGKVTLDSAGWYRGLRGIRSSMATYGKSIGEGFGRLKTAAMVAGAAAVAGLGLAMRSAQQYGDEIAKAATATGASTEELSGLRYAAQQSGLAWRDLLNAVTKATKMRPGQGIEAIADELKAIEDPAERTRAAMAIFGDDLARKVLPFLMQGSDGLAELKRRAGDLGLIVTAEQGAAAERFGDAMADLKSAVLGAVRSFFDFTTATNIVERLTGAIITFRRSATFANLRQGLADTANQFLDFGARVLATWESIEGGTKAALLSLGGTLAGFGALWYLGFVKPIVSGIASALFTTGAGLASMAVLLTGFGAALVGYKIGKAIEEAFDLGQVFASLNIDLKFSIREFTDQLDFLVRSAEWYWKALKGVFSGDMPDWAGFKEMAFRADELRKELKGELERAQAELAEFAEPKTPLKDAFAKQFSLDAFKEDLRKAGEIIKGLLPDATANALDDILAKWRAAAGIKFPPLPANARAKDDADNAERERDAKADMRRAEAPFRGITRLGFGASPAPAMNRFRPQLPRAMNTENPKLVALAQKQLEAEKEAAAWLAGMNAKAITIGTWQ
jgi:hypothetical protein